MNCKEEAKEIVKRVVRFLGKDPQMARTALAEQCEDIMEFLNWAGLTLEGIWVKDGTELFKIYSQKRKAAFN